MSFGLAIDTNRVERAYAAWAPIYDAICGPVLRSGIRAAVEAAQQHAHKILEIGVGTGLTFEYYRRNVELHGIDLSEAMLRRAQEKSLTQAPSVTSLRRMDAHRLEFQDGAFDSVLLPFVITLVSDPERVLSEAIRVTRPAGRVLLVNHFYSESGLLAMIERASGAAMRKIGLNPDFPYARIADYAAGDSRLLAVTRAPVGPFFTLVTMQKRD